MLYKVSFVSLFCSQPKYSYKSSANFKFSKVIINSNKKLHIVCKFRQMTELLNEFNDLKIRFPSEQRKRGETPIERPSVQTARNTC